ncbi:MAG: hypothetical protein F4Z28_05175, partial [Gammaproteobacteria bacterium]|nr:hypothetical protein [Gammaproteobacteria bacterium]
MKSPPNWDSMGELRGRSAPNPPPGGPPRPPPPAPARGPPRPGPPPPRRNCCIILRENACSSSVSSSPLRRLVMMERSICWSSADMPPAPGDAPPSVRPGRGGRVDAASISRT